MPFTLVFDEVTLSVSPRAMRGGPEASTTIVSNPFSGLSQRNVNRYDQLHRYEVIYDYLSPEELNELRAFFHCRDGMARGFRFRDWSEYWFSADGTAADPIATPNWFGEGDGATTEFGLYKRYSSGGVTKDRRIIKPVDGSITIYVNGVTPPAAPTVDYETGIVTFLSAPADGAELTVTGLFDVAVFFASDWFNPNLGDALTEISYQSLPLVEIPAAMFGLEL